MPPDQAVVASGASMPLVLRGGTVLTLDGAALVRAGVDVVVGDGRLQAIAAAAAAPPGGRVLDVSGCLVLPGLVQGHLHLGQTLFRGLAERRRLLAWLRERIWPLEAAHDDESAYWGALLGAAECLLGGTTTIQDIGLGPGAPGLLAAIGDSGLRAFAGMCLMDTGEGAPSDLLAATDDALAATAALGDRFDGAAGGRLRYALNPRFILSCSDALWRGVRELADQRGWPVHTHALEQRDETAAVRAVKGGRDEIDYFDDEGLLATDLRIAHGVWLEAQHLARVTAARSAGANAAAREPGRQPAFSVCHCPSSNLKLGSGIADLQRLRAAAVPVGIGADGAACSNTLDALEEVRLAALLQKLSHGPQSFGGVDALRLATSEGARALGLDREIGSVEVGKRADLLVLSLARPELAAAGSVDPHDLVVFGASRASVRHVLIDGELLVEDGRLTKIDLPAVRRHAERCRRDLLVRARLPLD